MTSQRLEPALKPLELAPMGLANAAPALRIAWDCFGSEAAVIALTYAWHGLRRWLPVDRMMASSTTYRIDMDGRLLGSVWRVTSLIHGGKVCWLACDLRADSDWARLLPRLLSRLAGRRCAIIRLDQPDPQLEAAGATPLGWLPGETSRRFWLYAARAGKPVAQSQDIVFSRTRCPLDISAQFHLVKRDDRPVGLTGLYMTRFWPRLAFGGWGALQRGVAQRGTAMGLLAATERLARGAQADWFMIETSDAPAYRAARRAYEWYGLELLLRIPGFFEKASDSDPGEAYLLYGRPLRMEGVP